MDHFQLAHILKAGKHPDMGTLVRAWLCYTKLFDGTKKTVKDVVDDFGGEMKEVTRCHRAMKEVATLIPRATGFFRKQQGEGTMVLGKDPRDKAYKDLFDEIEKVIEAYAKMLVRLPLRINVGASLSFCCSVLPDALSEFEKTNPDIGFDVDHGLPNELRKRGANGEFDLVLTSCPGNEFLVTEGIDKDEVVWETRLALYLVCHQEDRLAQNFTWEEVEKRTVILLRPRVPMPTYPTEKIEKAKKMYVESFPEAVYLVAGSRGSTVCFGFPQLFGSMEKGHLNWIDIADAMDPVRVCLLRPKRARDRRSADEAAIIGQLESALKQRLGGVRERIELQLDPATRKRRKARQ